MLGAAGFIQLLNVHYIKGANWMSLGYPHFLKEVYQYVWGYTLINVASGAAILACRDGNQIGAWLEHRALVYLGQIAYGVYVFHVPILDIVHHHTRGMDQWSPIGLAVSAASVVVVIAVSAASFRFFEKPILRFKGD